MGPGKTDTLQLRVGPENIILVHMNDHARVSGPHTGEEVKRFVMISFLIFLYKLS